MNRQKYESLPQKAKDAIAKHSFLKLSQTFGQRTNDQWAKSRAVVKDTVYTLAADQEAEWKKRLAPIAAEWSQGVPDGAKVLEAFRAEVAAERGKK